MKWGENKDLILESLGYFLSFIVLYIAIYDIVFNILKI